MKVDRVPPGVVEPAGSDDTPRDADTFSALASRVVAYLAERTPISSWSVNRVDHDVQVHLHTDGEMLEPGAEVAWEDSICRHVVEDGVGPVVPDLTVDPVLGRTPWPATVRGYAGRPILDGDGHLFGMLCGLHPEPLGADESIDVELLDLLASLLSAHATLARRAAAQHERDTLESATTDPRTGLLPPAAWHELLSGAGTRSRAFGDLGAVVVLQVSPHLAPLPPDVVRAAADATARSVETDESVTYLGDGIFASLLDDATPSTLASTVRGHRESLEARGLDVTVGWSLTSPADTSGHVVLDRALLSLAAERSPFDRGHGG